MSYEEFAPEELAQIAKEYFANCSEEIDYLVQQNELFDQWEKITELYKDYLPLTGGQISALRVATHRPQISGHKLNSAKPSPPLCWLQKWIITDGKVNFC